MARQTAGMGERRFIRDLGDGLVMRRASAEDAEALADFHARIQVDPGGPNPDPSIHAWVLDMASGRQPNFDPSDFLIVEDTRTGAIASSLCLISQEWAFGGIPLKVGQPEMVSTDEKYRRRGLVRAQFEVIHGLSAERGEVAQFITGIPWYYRQFGYEMALPHGGSRAGFKLHIPRLPEGQEEPFVLRPATEDDIPFMSDTYSMVEARTLVVAVRRPADWRYELSGRRPRNLMRSELRIIEARDGTAVGLLMHKSVLWGPTLACVAYELRPGVPWSAVTPSVLRYLGATGDEYARRDGGSFESFVFGLGGDHPVYQVIPERLPRVRKPYAWYVRVPDLQGFLRRIAPILEERLSRSPLAGYTGQLRLNFYRGGLRLSFEEGRVASVEGWRPDQPNDGEAGFPDLTFLNLVFGRRSFEEMEYALADCWAYSDDARALLAFLFPPMPSNILQVA